MESLTQPTLLLKPFAESGDKNSIPVTNTDASNPQLADLTNGFPQVTSEDPDDGGLPPERKDINGLGYLTTTYDYFYQAGGTFTFNPTISTAIGGYPLGARLWYTDSNGATTVVRSTIANNTNNFNDGSATGIGTTWVPEIPALGWNNTWTGNNTFSGSNIFNGAIYARSLFNQKLDAVLGTPPSSLKTANVGVVDNNGTWLGGWEMHYSTDGAIGKQFAVRKQDGTENYAIFGIGYDASQNESVYGTAGVTSGIARFSMPDYNAGVTKTGNWVAPSNGIYKIQFGGTDYGNEGKFSVNGVMFYGHTFNREEYQTIVAQVKKGDTIVLYSANGGSVFYPCIGG